ncbi:MAG: O-antigen ligase family protein [bacterium]|nr:O-antigen ligase family protein [bacterium]
MSVILAVFYRILTRKGTVWVVAASAVYTAGMFCSASRSGFLAFSICLMALFVFCVPPRAKAVIVAGLVVIALVLPLIPGTNNIIGSNPFTGRFATTTVDLDDPEAAQRRQLWVHAIREFLKSPIVGVGPGVLEHPLEPHNTYVSLLAHVGVLGFGFYLAAFAYLPIRVSVRAGVGTCQRLRTAGRCLAIAFLCIALAGITSNVENFRGLWMLMAIAYAFRGFYLHVPETATAPAESPVNEPCLSRPSAFA